MLAVLLRPVPGIMGDSSSLHQFGVPGMEFFTMPALRSLLPHVSATMLVGDPATEVRGIAYDSRTVQPGDLFACLPGTRVHGHQFIPQVLAAGAAALLVEDAGVVPAGVPAVVAADVREALARISAAFYRHPATALRWSG